MESNNFKNTSELDRLLSEMNREFFNEELADIVEVTYAYSDIWGGKVVNKTLFWKFLSKQYEWNDANEQKQFWENVGNDMKNIFWEVLVKLTFKRQLISRYKNKISSLQDTDNKRLQILLGALDYLDKILDLTLTGLPFEAEKAWLPHNLNKREIEGRIKRLEEIEKELFWPMVRKTKHEVIWSYQIFTDVFQQEKSKLTPEEQEQFLKFLQTLKNTFPYLSWTEEPMEKSKKKLPETPEVLKKEITRENYVKVFKIIFEIYDIKKEIKIEERSSIYDGEDYLGIPSSKAYETLQLSRVLGLIQHEIETHYIIEKNNSQTLGKFRWAGNLEREEWVAKVSEWTLKWKTLDDFWVQWAIPDLLMGEILSWEDYLKFFELLGKMDKEKMTLWLTLKDPKWTFLRRKRNYPLFYKWVQHKDTSYNRWEHKVINFLQKWWDIKDLYVWKVSFSDVGITKKILDEEWLKLQYPLLLWELLQYVITWNELKEAEFWNYIKGKYPFLDVEKEFSHKTIERLTYTMKKKIIQILDLL